ncbi:unnamed protein product [marine sediment metagenome]|uniref:RNA polymerase sigma-70 region 4 domain-containing protein n=1 Tax=marine sediment metagenome TaxID=412755 RepID=X1G0D2_9ZZZZ
MSNSKFIKSFNQEFIFAPLELMQKDMMERIKKLSTILSKREKTVLRLRFELGKKKQHQTLKEVGKYLNLVPERIRQVEIEALSKIQFSREKTKQLKILLRKFHKKELVNDYLNGMEMEKLCQKYNCGAFGVYLLFRRDFPGILQQRRSRKRKVSNTRGAPTIRLSGNLLETVGIKPGSYVKIYLEDGKIIMKPIL